MTLVFLLLSLAQASPRVIDAGYAHACVVESGKVRCWGGERGGDSLTDVAEVAAGAYFTCARRVDGTVWCWGENHSHGQLGDGTREDRIEPVQVGELDGVVAIDAGFGHACAVEQDGSVWCWGADGSGQLGDGTTADQNTPVLVRGLVGATDVSAGRGHTCAITRDGALWCWGANDAGQLGTGQAGRAPGPPAPVRGLEGVVAVSTGEFATCAVRRDGSAWCWGANEAGLLVLDAAPTLLVPTRVAGVQAVTQISSGQNHTCAVDVGGAVWCWGFRGATGAPSTDPSSYVHGAERLNGWTAKALSAGAGFTCFLTRAGPVICPGLQQD